VTKRSARIILLISIASLVIGAWELAITRLASLAFYFEVTYLALAVSLLALGLGAIFARHHLTGIRLTTVLGATALTMPPIWLLISRFDIAWVTLLFAVPFFGFGVASTIAWHEIGQAGHRRWLYCGEMLGAVTGLVIAGPLVLPFMAVNLLGDFGSLTHMRQLAITDGVVEHRHRTSAYARTDLMRTKADPDIVYLFTDAMFVTRAVR